MFVAYRNISILKKIDNLVKSDVYITLKDSDELNTLPITEYMYLVKDFSNSYEHDKYSAMRVYSILSNHLETTKDYIGNFEKYINAKDSQKNNKLTEGINHIKVQVLELLISELNMMLKPTTVYSEKKWQEKIFAIISFINPKYICSAIEVNLGDDGRHQKIVDFVLMDSLGFVDLLEIKKPNLGKIIYAGTDENNYVLTKIFTSTIMQTEKYLYTITTNSKVNKKILEKIKNKIDDNIDIEPRIINPTGMLLMGRSNDLTKPQIRDFEIVNRQYKNVIDILTYDVCFAE